MSIGESLKPIILAIDNAPMFLSTLERLLEGEPYELHCAATGDEALTFIQSRSPKLILLDVEMPDIDGYTLARRIKGSGCNAPIIIVTAHPEQEYADKATEAGAAGILHKPLRRAGLLEEIKKYIR